MMNFLAIDYHGNKVFEPRSGPVNAPGHGEVQIEVAYTGICGTDLTIARGGMDSRITSPWPIGHEMSGTIAMTGEGVANWEQGDKVTVMPLDWCDDCPACDRGLNHICHNLKFLGIDSPGALQQRWNVSADLLIPIPDELDLRTAALVEPVAVAVHDVHRASVRSGDRVAVIGGGPIGLLIATVARKYGADVLISEIARFRIELAASLGFNVVNPMQDDLAAIVDEWTEGRGADIAFEVSGSAAGIVAVTEVLAVRGRAVIVGIHSEAPRVNLFQVFWKELELAGARVYLRSDFEEALELLTDGTIPADRLITDVMPLDETVAAFQRLASGADIVKLLIAANP